MDLRERERKKESMLTLDIELINIPNSKQNERKWIRHGDITRILSSLDGTYGDCTITSHNVRERNALIPSNASQIFKRETC